VVQPASSALCPSLSIACTIREGIRLCRLSRPSRHLSTKSGQLQESGGDAAL
jgi:hypothetical protein